MKSTTDINTLWQQRIDSWRNSGLKQSVWCRQNNVKAPQFWYWKKKLSSTPDQVLHNEKDEIPEAKVMAAPAFVPVAITPEAPALAVPSCLTVTLANGLTVSDINTSNIALVGRLIEALL